MLKFVVVQYKRPDMTFEQFRHHLLQVHAPLAKKIPGLRKCIYNLVLEDDTRKAPGWHGIVELYFDDFPSMQAAWATPEGQAATNDNAQYADLTQTSWSVVEQITIL
ncbi:MAG: EthD family reductase [Candidatus Acidiferrales bacterium]